MKDLIVNAAKKRILFLTHAIQQMSRPERMISEIDVRETIFEGEIIEEYPKDQRGLSCLMLHRPSGRTIHIVCSPKDNYLAIITAYIPNQSQWDENFRKRV